LGGSDRPAWTKKFVRSPSQWKKCWAWCTCHPSNRRKVEYRKIMVQAILAKNETLFKITKGKGVVEYLLHKCKALSSNPCLSDSIFLLLRDNDDPQGLIHISLIFSTYF
jgi:hypothetical protein